MSAPVRIEAEAWTDLRFATLARILGLAEADHALIRTARIWSWQAEHYTPEAPTYVVDLDTIESALGTGGGAALVRARLAEDAPGGYRIRGAAGRIEWLWQKRQAARAGGEATKRKHGNKQGPHGLPHGEPAAELMPSPLVPALVPDLPEDRSSLPAHAIPPTAVPEPPPVPAVSPPAPVREDVSSSQPKYTREHGADSSYGPRSCTTVVSENTRNTPENMLGAATAYNPDDPRSRGRLAEATYRRVSDARVAIAAELKLPEQLPFPAVTPSSRAGSFRDLLDRMREEGALAAVVCDRVVENLIAQAREERSIEWLAEKAFSEGGWRTARGWMPAASRPAKPARPGAPAAAPSRKPDPGPAAVVLKRTPEQLAELAAMSKAVAAMPTSELVKRFGDGDGARAPPASAHPTSPDPDEKPRRKAAT